MKNWKEIIIDNQKTMRKLIDIKDVDILPLKILAVKANKDLKNYIQDLLSEHVLKAKK
jgi:hypothetical protein